MPFAPPAVPSRFQLGPVRVGNPVSAYHGARLVNDTAELHGTNVQTFADCTFGYNYGGGSISVPVFWSRSPGCQALLVGVELQPISSATATVTVTNAGAALTWIQANGLDGTATIASPPTSTAIPQVHHGVVDASGFLTDGTVNRLTFSIATTTGALLERVFVREIPLAQVAPESAPATEVSANAAWPSYRPGAADRAAGLVDGTASGSLGFVRLHDQIEKGRTRWRDWRQFAFFESDANTPSTTSTVMAPLVFRNGGSYTPAWYTRSRRLCGTTAGTAVAETAQVLVRYKCTAASGGTLRLIVGGTNFDLPLATAGAYTTASLGTITLPTNAGQRVSVGVQAKLASAGTLYLPNLTFYSLET